MALTGAERQRRYRERNVQLLRDLRRLLTALRVHEFNKEKVVLEVDDITVLLAAAEWSHAEFVRMLAELV